MSIHDYGPRELPEPPEQMLRRVAGIRRLQLQQHPDLVQMIKAIGQNAEGLTVSQKAEIRQNLSDIKEKYSGPKDQKNKVIREIQRVEQALLIGGGIKRARDETEEPTS